MTLDQTEFAKFYVSTIEKLSGTMLAQSQGLFPDAEFDKIIEDSYHHVFNKLHLLQNRRQAVCLLFVCARNLTNRRLQQMLKDGYSCFDPKAVKLILN